MPRREGHKDRRATPEAVLAVDVGGTNLRVALVDRGLSLVRRRQEPSDRDADPGAVLERLQGALEAMREEAPVRVAGVGFSLAGILDAGEGTVHQCPNLSPRWKDFRLRDELEKSLGLPSVIGNDANLAAMAESLVQAPDARCLLYLTVSTGIGGGVVYRGESFLGGKGLGPEVGHIVVVAGGPRCACGGQGCLESLASGSAIAREAQQALHRGPAGVMASLVRQGHPLDARAVHEAAQAGDAAALGVLERAGHYLGLGLASLAHAFCPDIIVVGGGVSNAGELVLGPARKAFAEQTMAAYQAGVHIVPAALGDDSALVGAALVAWRRAGHRKARGAPSLLAQASRKRGLP